MDISILNHAKSQVNTAKRNDMAIMHYKDDTGLQKLILHGTRNKGRSYDDISEVEVAARASYGETGRCIPTFIAEAHAQNNNLRTVVQLTSNKSDGPISLILATQHPDMTLTNPRPMEGEVWLRQQFQSISKNVKDAKSRPNKALLERVVSRNLGPAEGRSVSDVY